MHTDLICHFLSFIHVYSCLSLESTPDFRPLNSLRRHVMEYLNKVGTNLNILVYHDFSVDEEAVELVLDAVGVGVLVVVLLREDHLLLHAV